MINRWFAFLTLIVGVTCVQITDAAAPTTAQAEIEYLLGFVGMSGCQFYRNGTWNDATAAQAHLRYKYEVLSSRIKSAEDFIDKAATKSSLSGQAYAIGCGDGSTMSSSQWLLDALARYRAEAATDPDHAPRVTRNAPVSRGQP